MRRLIKEGLCFNEADCSVLLLCRVDRGLVLFVQLWSLSDQGRVVKSKFSILLDTLLSLTSLPFEIAILLRALMGLLFRGKVAPFSAVRMGFIYREIEDGSRRGDLNLYWSLIRPVLVAARSSIGVYCQPVLVG